MSNIPNSTLDDLKTIAKRLPRGAYAKIAKRYKIDGRSVSDEYIRRFFRGDYNLSDDNIKIIDIAQSIVKAQLRLEAKIQNKVNEMLSKGKE